MITLEHACAIEAPAFLSKRDIHSEYYKCGRHESEATG